MSEQFKKNADYLHVLCRCNKTQRKGIIEGANQELIDTICECVENILDGRINLSPNEYKRLKRYQKELRQLRDKKTSLSQKKEALIQKTTLPVMKHRIPPDLF